MYKNVQYISIVIYTFNICIQYGVQSVQRRVWKTSTVRSKSHKRVDLNGIYQYCAIKQVKVLIVESYRCPNIARLALN